MHILTLMKNGPYIKNSITESANHTVGKTRNPRNEKWFNDDCRMVIENKHRLD